MGEACIADKSLEISAMQAVAAEYSGYAEKLRCFLDGKVRNSLFGCLIAY
jgi:hypothetical protein